MKKKENSCRQKLNLRCPVSEKKLKGYFKNSKIQLDGYSSYGLLSVIFKQKFLIQGI